MATHNGIDGQARIRDWIQKGLDRDAIRYAEAFGRYLTRPDDRASDALTTSQIRNVFGEVKKIQMKGFDLRGLLLLKPRLAYAAKRAKSKGSEYFRDDMDRAIDAVVDADNAAQQECFDNFVSFFEAILAYHRASGGK